MPQFRTLACAAAAAALLTALPAAAIVKVATYTGTIGSGTDASGLFTAPGTDLAGYSYVARYTYDRALGAYQVTDGATYDFSFGGTVYGPGVSSPTISAAITINGVTKSIAGTFYGNAQTSNYNAVVHEGDYYFDDGVTTRLSYIFNTDTLNAAASLDQNWGPVAQSGTGGGFMYVSVYEYATGSLLEYAFASLNADGTYSVGNAVPEPSTWALMIAGFGLVGTAVRRRKALAAA